MRKKFIGAFLLGLLALGTAGTITSCKDYDGDISSLKNDLSSLNSTLSSQLTDLQNQLTAQKAELLTKLTTAETNLYAAIDKKADKTTVENLASTVSSIQTELATVNSRLSTIEADIQTINGILATKADKTALEAAKTDLEQKISDAQATLQAAIDQKADKTVTDALQDQIDALKNRVSALETSLAKDEEEIAADKADLAAYKIQVAADIATITGDITELQTAIEALQDADKTLAQNILDEVAARTTADENLQKAIDDAIAAQGVINDTVAQQIADLVTADGQLQDQINNLVLADQALQASLDETNAKVAANYNELSQEITALKTTVQENMVTVENQIANIYETMATKAELSNLETSLKKLMQEADDALNTALTAKIDVVSANVNTLNFLITKRLTSIYFAPSTYVLGVEAISINTLKYPDWSNDPQAWYADGPAEDHKIVYTGDKEATAEYYLNPTGVDESSIASLSFISNQATDVAVSRSGNAAPIAVSSYSIKDNKLTVKLLKTDSIYAPFEPGSSDGFKDFTIVSLKATLAESVLTSEEKANGGEVNVYSDWARVIETQVTPYIHNAKYYNEEEGYAQCDYMDHGPNSASHFYRFSQIYYGADSLNTVYKYDNKHIALYVNYEKDYDLDSLMMVCDGKGNKIEASSYGLHFEFSAPKYLVANQAETTDATDQSKYIKMSGDRNNVIRAITPQGILDNRSVIGKTPVIQARLVDENGVVLDVRYFRVQWVDGDPSTTTLEEKTGTSTYSCGEVYTLWVGESYMNDSVYALENGGKGMTQEEFQTTYKLDPCIYSTPEAAIEGDGSEEYRMGNAEDLISSGKSTQAHNLEFEFYPIKLTENLYNGTDTTLVAYAAFRDMLGTQIRVIPLKMTVHFDQANKAGYAYNYNSTYWKGELTTTNADKYVVANPTLETDNTYGTTAGYTDSQILYSLLNAYIKDNVAPANTWQLLKNVDQKHGHNVYDLTFDEDRLDILPVAKEDDKWTVSNENGYSYLLYNGVKAVSMKQSDGMIKLIETTKPGKNGVPADGALLLVNYDWTSDMTVANTKNAVPVKITSTTCELPVVIDKFLVRFEQPLAYDAKALNVTVMDQWPSSTVGSTTYPGSVGYTDATKKTPVTITGLISIKETFGAYRTVSGVSALESWYIVKSPVYDEANILINVDGNGNILGDDITEWSNVNDLKNKDKKQLYKIDLITVSGKEYVRYQNLNGNALTEDLKAVIPVTLDAKWRKGYSCYVNVTIKANTSTGTAKLK